jgi:hypothetical protein
MSHDLITVDKVSGVPPEADQVSGKRKREAETSISPDT